jgi:AcrR family transcriptional regulator
MFSKFLNLDPVKQNIILNAAIKQFAQKGYKNASTNEIVKEAGISKGLLFHYFTNKQELYLYSFNHLVQVLTEKIYSKIDWDERDIFIKYKQIAYIKIGILQQYPDMFNFFQRTFLEDSPEIKTATEKFNKEVVADIYSKLFGDLNHVDVSKFKEGIDIQKSINIIYWSLEGFGNQYRDLFNSTPADQINMEEIAAGMESYLEILKKVFYKE